MDLAPIAPWQTGAKGAHLSAKQGVKNQRPPALVVSPPQPETGASQREL